MGAWGAGEQALCPQEGGSGHVAGLGLRGGWGALTQDEAQLR